MAHVGKTGGNTGGNTADDTVHVLKVTLRDVEPPVWRQVVVPSSTLLPAFSEMLVQTMGWEGHHLHMFEADGVLYGDPEEDDVDEEDYVVDEAHATVQLALPHVNAALRWDYDFGDGWQHDVEVLSIDRPHPGTRYPSCTDGERACPPEDCGGPHSYAQLLSILADPTDPRYAEMAGWVPQGFDPDVFDIATVNRKLRGR